MSVATEVYRLVVVNAGTSNPSSTAMLADRVVEAVRDLAAAQSRPIALHALEPSEAQDAQAPNIEVAVTVVELRELATEIATGLITGNLGPGLEDARVALAAADGVVAVTPVYKAESSGLFSGFFQVLDRDILIGTPTVLGATAGTLRHALVVDGPMRAQFAYLRTLTVPTSLFAATEDWNDPALSKRIRRAATELWLLVRARFAAQLREANRGAYQHDFDVSTVTAADDFSDIDLSSDLMRLATGGH